MPRLCLPTVKSLGVPPLACLFCFLVRGMHRHANKPQSPLLVVLITSRGSAPFATCPDPYPRPWRLCQMRMEVCAIKSRSKTHPMSGSSPMERLYTYLMRTSWRHMSRLLILHQFTLHSNTSLLNSLYIQIPRFSIPLAPSPITSVDHEPQSSSTVYPRTWCVRGGNQAR